MQLAEYYIHYRDFNLEFFPDETLPDIEQKLLEEFYEFIDALKFGDVYEGHSVDEGLDLLNVLLKWLKVKGIKDPLHAGYEKLQRTAEKYRAERYAK